MADKLLLETSDKILQEDSTFILLSQETGEPPLQRGTCDTPRPRLDILGAAALSIGLSLVTTTLAPVVAQQGYTQSAVLMPSTPSIPSFVVPNLLETTLATAAPFFSGNIQWFLPEQSGLKPRFPVQNLLESTLAPAVPEDELGEGDQTALVFSPRSIPAWEVPRNTILLEPVVPESVPFHQDRWPNPIRPSAVPFSFVANKTQEAVATTQSVTDSVTLLFGQKRVPAFQPQNLLETTLAPVVSGEKPFYQDLWPNPPKQARLEAYRLQHIFYYALDSSAPFYQNEWVNPPKARRGPVDFTSAKVPEEAAAVTGQPVQQATTPLFAPKRALVFNSPNTIPLLTLTPPVFPQIRQNEWVIPAIPPVAPSFQPENTIPLLTAPVSPAPFKQTQWPNPIAPKPLPMAVKQFLGFYVLDASAPFYQNEWTNPAKPKQVPRWEVPYNVALRTVPPVYPQIRQSEWVIPASPRPIPAWEAPFNRNIASVPPVQPQNRQNEWVIPQPPQPRDLKWSQNLLESTLVTFPIGKSVEGVPKGPEPRDLKWSQNLLENTLAPIVPIPAGKSIREWPIPRKPAPTPAWEIPYNVSIGSIPPVKPQNRQSDWPIPQGPRPRDLKWSQNLLETTLAPEVVLPPGTEIILASLETTQTLLASRTTTYTLEASKDTLSLLANKATFDDLLAEE